MLAGLREEKAKLSMELARVDRAIEALEEATGTVRTSEPAVSVDAPSAPSAAAAFTLGPNTGCSLYEAAALYLETAGEPRTHREIAEALRAGGYPTRAANFPASVRTMLQRSLHANPFGIHQITNENIWFFRDPDSVEQA
ncbi:MAG TPA: hypothetical protein VGQ36_08720 [Thermoanaerobaculia bacterium]|nr:hypothetical protein [Thermoanaerobaculia bacterium]